MPSCTALGEVFSPVKEQIIQRHLFKMVRQALFKGRCGNRCEDHCNGVVWWGREIGLHSEYSRGK